MEHLLKPIQNLLKSIIQVGLYGLKIQNTFGDFHIKTNIGILSGECLVIAGYLKNKVKLMNFNLDEEYNKYYTLKIVIRDTDLKMSLLCNLIERLQKSIHQLEEVKKHQDDFWWDSDFFWQMEQINKKFTTYLTLLKNWRKIQPSETRELKLNSGLLRDCDIFDILLSNTEESIVPRSLKEKDLLNPQLKAAYLSSNAYLEITSIDILSDLILEAIAGNLHLKYPWMITSLGRQVIDECQHAEMLAKRLDSIGFRLGMNPISLNTWICYKSFKSLPEKVVAQQIVQEGVGLDSSALNIKRFKKISDIKTCYMYQKITADELNHVRLGVNILNTLAPTEANEIFFETKKSVLKIDPFLPKVPVSVELKRKTGMPKNWI